MLITVLFCQWFWPVFSGLAGRTAAQQHACCSYCLTRRRKINVGYNQLEWHEGETAHVDKSDRTHCGIAFQLNWFDKSLYRVSSEPYSTVREIGIWHWHSCCAELPFWLPTLLLPRKVPHFKIRIRRAFSRARMLHPHHHAHHLHNGPVALLPHPAWHVFGTL